MFLTSRGRVSPPLPAPEMSVVLCYVLPCCSLQILMNVEWPEKFPYKDEDFSRLDEYYLPLASPALDLPLHSRLTLSYVPLPSIYQDLLQYVGLGFIGRFVSVTIYEV